MKLMDQRWEQFLFAISVLAVAVVVSRILRFLIGRFIRGAAQKLKVDPTRYNFFKNAADFIIYFTASIIIFRSIPYFRTVGTTLLASAGVLAAIVGFASQSAFSNIISGFFLVIFKPFRVGDRVRVGQHYSGDVEDITLRHTVIKDFENRRVVIPNSVISNETIINSTITEEKVCMFVEIPFAFHADLNRIFSIMQEESLKHPFCIDNRTPLELQRGDHPVITKVININETGMLVRAWVWARNPSDGFDLKCDLFKQIQERCLREGIEIAYPHRTLIYRNQPETD